MNQMIKRINSADIERIGAALENAPAKESRALSARDLVAQLAPKIKLLMREKGYSLRDASELLSVEGIKISSSTLGAYLRALEEEKKKLRDARQTAAASAALGARPAGAHGGTQPMHQRLATPQPGGQRS